MNYLSKKQKAHLCQLAGQAWREWSGREEFLRANPDYTPTAAFEAWRRVQQREACGVESLTACTSERHYLLLRAHWQHLLGRDDRASQDLHKHASENSLIVLHKIRESCAERGLDYPAYPAAICRRQYKCALEEASERQLWTICYTVRNRRKVGGDRRTVKPVQANIST